MKKIAILSCLNACNVCTGTACLRAWNTRTKSFGSYAQENVQLTAFLHCNGCGVDPAHDPGMAEKLERLVRESVDTVHLGICTRDKSGNECPVITQLAGMFEERGMALVRGTH